ncbi:MAG: acyl carrier protein [Candidatus Pacebacteria bacterium]|nr:acyl carrier protein [Candidatus Paceibacterota bacterium]
MPNLLQQISEIVSETTGNDPAEMNADSDLIEDLNFSDVEFKRVVAAVNKYFNISLNLREVTLEEIQTLGEFADIVAEETELG